MEFKGGWQRNLLGKGVLGTLESFLASENARE